jgi:copper chaperone CopZ
MTRFSVPDMNCKHCQTSIETALSAMPDSGPVRVDLDSHVLTTEGHAPADAILAALAEIGYPATVLA